MNRGKKRLPKLRTCASCEWVFHLPESLDPSCPKCGFGSYGARYVYGSKAYNYINTQVPWKRKKLATYTETLNQEIQTSTENLSTKGQKNATSLSLSDVLD